MTTLATRRRLPGVLLALCACLLPVASLFADAQTDRRVLVGLKLFPAVLAADQDLAAKAHQGRLRLLIVSEDPTARAEALAERLRAVGEVRGLPVDVRSVSYRELSQQRPPVAGVFVADRAVERIAAVVEFSREHQAISFSPFKGDVSMGIVAGLSISERILPLVNLEAAGEASIRLKPFFLSIAKQQRPGEDE